MKFFINGAAMGECMSYEQVRGARRPGWLFRMASGLDLFLPFDEIQSFTSSPDLRITERPARTAETLPA